MRDTCVYFGAFMVLLLLVCGFMFLLEHLAGA